MSLKKQLKELQQQKREELNCLHVTYLRTKRDRMGHILHHQGLALDEEMIHGEQMHDREVRERAESRGSGE